MTQSSERSPSAQESPSSCLAAPAEAGQGVGTSSRLFALALELILALLGVALGSLLAVAVIWLLTAWICLFQSCQA
jgi:hypothetical protein